MLYCAKIIEETDLKRRRMKSEDRKMKEIEMTKMVEEMDLRNLTPEVDMTRICSILKRASASARLKSL